MKLACDDKAERLRKPLSHGLWGMTRPREKQQAGCFTRFRGG
jgi:hypothetical protein